MTRELVFKSGLTPPSLQRTHCYIWASSPHGLVPVICSPKRKCQMVFASPSAMPDSCQPSPSPFQAEPAAAHPENPLWPSCSVGQWPGQAPEPGRLPGQVHQLMGTFDSDKLGPHVLASRAGVVLVLWGTGEGGSFSGRMSIPQGWGPPAGC